MVILRKQSNGHITKTTLISWERDLYRCITTHIKWNVFWASHLGTVKSRYIEHRPQLECPIITVVYQMLTMFPVNSKFSQLQYLCPHRSLRHAINIQTIPHPQQLYSTTTVIKENLVIPDIHSIPQDDPGIPRGGHALHSTFLCCRPASDSCFPVTTTREKLQIQ